MPKYLKMASFGILTWLIPFALSLFFYTRTIPIMSAALGIMAASTGSK